MKPTLELITTTGQSEGQIELPAHIFQAKINPELVAQAIRVYQHRQRQASAYAKGRSDVAYTKAKMYRQKGTGKARHGAKSAPIFVGGGVAHGPGGQHYKLKLSKKMRRLALYSVLTQKLNQQAISLIKGFEKIDGKTKSFTGILNTLKLPQDKLILVMLDKTQPQVIRATRGLSSVHTTQAKRINIYEVLRHTHLILTPESLEVLSQLHSEVKA
jgi:large subunit ribosomal protein L4